MKKKGIIIFIILLVLGGTVFYLGWIQIHLDNDNYAVLFTKLNGYQKELIKPGVFSWKWQKVIPTNMKMYIFHLIPQHQIISYEGVFPSADLYSKYLEGNPDFSYTLKFQLSFMLKPEFLPDLVSEQNLKPDSIENWYKDFSSGCIRQSVLFLQNKSTDILFFKDIDQNFFTMQDELINYLSNTYPMVEITRITPLNIIFPDFELYTEAKRQYLALAKIKYQTIAESLKLSSSTITSETAKLEILDKYGELFSKYPVLLDYLSIPGNEINKLIPELQIHEAVE